MLDDTDEQAMLDLCAANDDYLSEWESEFVASLQDWEGSLTDRQLEILEGLAGRINTILRLPTAKQAELRGRWKGRNRRRGMRTRRR